MFGKKSDETKRLEQKMAPRGRRHASAREVIKTVEEWGVSTKRDGKK